MSCLIHIVTAGAAIGPLVSLPLIFVRARSLDLHRKRLTSRRELSDRERRQCIEALLENKGLFPLSEGRLSASMDVWVMVAAEVEISPGFLRTEDVLRDLSPDFLPWSHTLIDNIETAMLAWSRANNGAIRLQSVSNVGAPLCGIVTLGDLICHRAQTAPGASD